MTLNLRPAVSGEYLARSGLLEKLFVERMDQNEEIFVRFMNDPAFQKIVTNWISDENFGRALPNAPKITSGKVLAHSKGVPALV